MNVVCCQLEVSATGDPLSRGEGRGEGGREGGREREIRCTDNPLHLQWVGRRGQTKQGRQKFSLSKLSTMYSLPSALRPTTQ